MSVSKNKKSELPPFGAISFKIIPTPAHSAEIATEFSSLWGRLPFKGKCTLHREMIEVEMQRLNEPIGKAANFHAGLK